MLNNLDLFKIRIIGEVTKSGSVAQAARALRITPSAISQNLKALELVLGRPLFLRVGKTMKPTPLALGISKKAGDFFSDLSILLEDSVEQTAELKIGAPPIFGSTQLLERLETIRSKFPSVRLSVSTAHTHRLLKELLDGEIDFAFVDSGPFLKSMREIAAIPFTEENLHLCCSAEFYKKHLSGGVSLKALKALPHIRYSRDKEGVYKWYFHHYGKLPIESAAMFIDHTLGVLNAVAKGWGLGVLPEALIAEEVKRKRLVIINGPKGVLKSGILIAQNKNHIPSRIEKAVMSALMQK